MRKLTVQAISKTVIPIFQKLSVEVVYLYGSVTRGQSDHLSDYDFGILFSKKLSSKKSFALRLKLFSLLAKNLGVYEDKIDVVDLQTVPTLLQFNAISGKIIYLANQESKVEFETSVMGKYHDEQYYLDQYLFQTIKKLEKGVYFERRLLYA